MAQLKDSQVVGDLRVTGEIIGNVSGDLHGVADKVQNSFILTVSGGTTEGIDKYTFDGSVGKTLNIIPADSNTVLTTSANGELVIKTKNDYAKVKYYSTTSGENYPLLLSYYTTSTSGDKTNYARYTSKIFCKPSDGSLTSSGTITAKNGFVGYLTGTASKAYPTTEGSPSKPIYWSSTGSPIMCNNTLDVSVTGSAKKYDTSFTGDNSIYDSLRYTGITAHIVASINAGGALVVNSTNSSCYTTVHGVTQELSSVLSNQEGSLMNFLGFSPNGNIPTMFQNADTIFIILTGNATYTTIATNLFDTSAFRVGFRKRLIMNNCINTAVTISLKNGKSGSSPVYLILKGEQKTLSVSGSSYNITLPGNSSHIYDIYTPGSSSMIFLQDF